MANRGPSMDLRLLAGRVRNVMEKLRSVHDQYSSDGPTDMDNVDKQMEGIATELREIATDVSGWRG